MLLPCPWLLPNYNAEFRGCVEDLMDQQDLDFYLLQDLGSRGGTVPTRDAKAEPHCKENWTHI